MEKYSEKLFPYITDRSEIVVLSYGMGVESTAILLRWILEPETCPCPLDKLLVITAQVGEEWPDTGTDVEKYILPLFREKNIRFIQVARHGHHQKDGITVLDDTRSAQRCFIDGDYSNVSSETITRYIEEQKTRG